MGKDTSEILEELGLCQEFKTFYQENKEYMVTQSLAQLLTQLLEQTGMEKPQIVKKSEIAEVYVYQIFSGLRVPTRRKLLALAVGMELNLEQVQMLLKCAGYPRLYVKRPADSVVIFGICNHLTVRKINEMLFEYGLETIG